MCVCAHKTTNRVPTKRKYLHQIVGAFQNYLNKCQATKIHFPGEQEQQLQNPPTWWTNRESKGLRNTAASVTRFVMVNVRFFFLEVLFFSPFFFFFTLSCFECFHSDIIPDHNNWLILKFVKNGLLQNHMNTSICVTQLVMHLFSFLYFTYCFQRAQGGQRVVAVPWQKKIMFGYLLKWDIFHQSSTDSHYQIQRMYILSWHVEIEQPGREAARSQPLISYVNGSSSINITNDATQWCLSLDQSCLFNAQFFQTTQTQEGSLQSQTVSMSAH